MMRFVIMGMMMIAGGVLAGCAHQYYNVATQQEETFFYTTEKEVTIGDSLAAQVERAYALDNDPLIQQRIRDIGQKVAAGCDRQEIRYRFSVIAEKEINAFALPGGNIYMFRGLWDKLANSDDAIAAVLAHEIAHVTARHSIKRLQASYGYTALAVLVGVSREMDAYAKSKAIAGLNELVLAYSRDDELQADALSVRYLQNAGYDPSAMLRVLNILQQVERERPIQPAHWRTHPYHSERKRIIREQVNRGTIHFDDYITSQR